jgi:hypothetical protein
VKPTQIRLTQANTKERMQFMTHNIFYYGYSSAQKATLIVSTGGAFVPVLETPEKVEQLIFGLTPNSETHSQEESTNGK